eukprot:TRINITY_DN5064_c0_g1_i5.p2 TRINITY_DN5064_c0_g1~~TRINITY_DN5064_c0_g1_i5.p2  ORF type:complete len:154 (-),score=20.83 TRINITY_DN5064_c0_g1_i5:6-467(-)
MSRAGMPYSTAYKIHQKYKKESDLLSTIPKGEVTRMSNGRWVCTVCSNRPVMDTIQAVKIHRAGKRHKTQEDERSQYLNRNKSKYSNNKSNKARHDNYHNDYTQEANTQTDCRYPAEYYHSNEYQYTDTSFNDETSTTTTTTTTTKPMYNKLV